LGEITILNNTKIHKYSIFFMYKNT